VKTHLKTSQAVPAMLLLNIPALVGWSCSGKITLMEALMGKFAASNIFLLKDVAKWVYEIR
jgi:ABC-type hemin transport system ATPase subunit